MTVEAVEFASTPKKRNDPIRPHFQVGRIRAYSRRRPHDGSILKYFEEVGGAHYRGDCFVFDRRVALTPALLEAGYAARFNCWAVVSPEEQRAERYEFGKSCPHFFP